MDGETLKLVSVPSKVFFWLESEFKILIWFLLYEFFLQDEGGNPNSLIGCK